MAMTTPRMSVDGLTALAQALRDPEVLARYRVKLVTVPGSPCVWFAGAISNRGHGRFWYAPGRVVIAHRFAYAIKYGAAALGEARVLGHRCDNPLCQRVAPGHVEPSSPRQNRREWAARRRVAGGPLVDPRGARVRARALRDLARADPRAVGEELESLRVLLGEQLTMPLQW